jgi:hypothetical protein
MTSPAERRLFGRDSCVRLNNLDAARTMLLDLELVCVCVFIVRERESDTCVCCAANGSRRGR